jgi:hypothetical protein
MLTFLYILLSLVLNEGSLEILYVSNVSENLTLFIYIPWKIEVVRVPETSSMQTLLHANITRKQEQHH